ILPIALVITAAFFRLWRISELTEFLGDQGRTGMVIYDAWRTGILPLAGPTVLSGQHLGPFFYYLIGLPFIIGGFNPVIPSAFVAVLGIVSVYVLYQIASRLWGLWIGWSVAMLLAVAAYLLRADRTIWEPSVIPVFVLLYFWCVYSLFEHRRYWYLLPMGAIVGILVQLHYPNIFFIGLSIGVLLLLLIRRKTPKKTVLLWFSAGIAGFFVILSPFLWYEARHAWIDLREMAIILVGGGSGGQASYTYWERLMDASSKLFGYLAPEAPKWFIAALQLFVLAAAFWRRTFWSIFLAAWYVVGIVSIGLYRGVIFDHYLFFLLPLPYLLLGHAVWSLRKYIPVYMIIGLMGLFVVVNVRRTDVLSPGPKDVSRVQRIVAEVLTSAKDQPFSFTLTSSRSFSDLHYRYFFKLADVEPKPITEASYSTLFLICDLEPCPTADQMRQKPRVQALCFEPHCKGTYPTVDLSNWELKTMLYAPEGRIYMFQPSGERR
ncbi:MAG: glycosyltransferase family 39 protein, partial [Patescibacteria group bacterium]